MIILSAVFIFSLILFLIVCAKSPALKESDETQAKQAVARNNNYELNMDAYYQGIELYVPKGDGPVLYDIIKDCKGNIRV